MLMNSDQPKPNYDFITSVGKPPKRSFLTGNSKKQRIIIFLGGITILIIVTLIIGSVIGAANSKAGNNLIDLAAYQNELSRVIGIGATKSREAGLKNKAITAKYVLNSDYQLSARMIKARKIKIPKDFATRYSSTVTDKLLEDAEKANDFDAQYQAIYTEKLTNYKAKLAEIYPTLSPAEQVIIKQQNTDAKILLGESIE